jgi:hypothetical protein
LIYHNKDCVEIGLHEMLGEIERLRAALEAIADHDAYGWTLQTELAYAALEGEKTND